MVSQKFMQRFPRWEHLSLDTAVKHEGILVQGQKWRSCFILSKNTDSECQKKKRASPIGYIGSWHLWWKIRGGARVGAPWTLELALALAGTCGKKRFRGKVLRGRNQRPHPLLASLLGWHTEDRVWRKPRYDRPYFEQFVPKIEHEAFWHMCVTHPWRWYKRHRERQ